MISDIRVTVPVLFPLFLSFYFLFFFLVLDETGSHYVNQAGLTLLILLPQSPSLGFTEYTIMWSSDSAF